MPHPNDEQYQELADKILKNIGTPEEEMEFARWYNSNQDDPVYLDEKFASDEPTLENRIYKTIKSRLSPKKQPVKIAALVWYYAAAVILLLLLPVAFYHYLNQPPAHDAKITRNEKGMASSDIRRENGKAVLTLADGSEISLDSGQNNLLVDQGTIILNKESPNRLIYNSGSSTSKILEAMNRISTSKGGIYEITLSDGTKVWLNAESCLRFPTSFRGKERVVELAGEAYFEVSENKRFPFKVKAGEATIEVLGTHFNVSAYTNEPALKATLIQGSIRVDKGTSQQQIRPGQQAVIAENIKVSDVVAEEAISWKNNEFQFSNDDLKSVMRQLERWYDVKIDYKKNSGKHFTGTISRSSSLSEVLKMLELTAGIKFSVRDKTIAVN